MGALLHLASHDSSSRNTVVKHLVAILDARSAAAQMKAAEALAVLAARSAENRKAITASNAIPPLVRTLGDGRRTRANTPQERAAAVLADLARSGENKPAIVKARAHHAPPHAAARALARRRPCERTRTPRRGCGRRARFLSTPFSTPSRPLTPACLPIWSRSPQAGGVLPLVAMLSSDAPEARQHAAGALWHLAALGDNKKTIVDAGGIPALVALLSSGSTEAQKFAAGALWHLASSADNKIATVNAGAIEPLVTVLSSKSGEAREYAAAVLSTLARTQGGNKKAIARAGAIVPLIGLLTDGNTMTQKHAACSLWGLADGKDGVYDKEIAVNGGVAPLISLLRNNDPDTRGFAAACLNCLCKDPGARTTIVESGGGEPLLALAHGPATWLSNQAKEMLELLGIPLGEPESAPVLAIPTILMPAAAALPSLPLPASAKDFADVPPEMHAGLASGRVPVTPGGASGRGSARKDTLTARQRWQMGMSSNRSHSGKPKMHFHFFSFQIHHLTGQMGSSR